MGYDIRVTGAITVTPPLPWRDINGSPYLPGHAWAGDKAVTLAVREDVEETDDATIVRRHAYEVVPVTTDRYGARTLVEDVQHLIDVYPGHTFAGRLNCAGEEPGDLWRVEVHDGRAVRVEPRIVWPDGSEGLS